MNLEEKIKNNTQALFESISALSEEKANAKIDDNTWSVLECLEHIFLVDVGVSKTLIVDITADNKNDKSELFSEGKLNYLLVDKRQEFKVPAPDFVSPTGRFKTLVEAQKSIEVIIEKIISHIKLNAIENEKQTIQHPRLGEMTKLDWVHFLMAHTKRHVLQIEEIKQKV